MRGKIIHSCWTNKYDANFITYNRFLKCMTRIRTFYFVYFSLKVENKPVLFRFRFKSELWSFVSLTSELSFISQQSLTLIIILIVEPECSLHSSRCWHTNKQSLSVGIRLATVLYKAATEHLQTILHSVTQYITSLNLVKLLSSILSLCLHIETLAL